MIMMKMMMIVNVKLWCHYDCTFLYQEYQLGKQLAGSLEEVCGNRRYGPDETEFVRDLKTAAETLRDLHNEGWIHGEIQLSNIVIETAPPPSTERKVNYQQYTVPCRIIIIVVVIIIILLKMTKKKKKK